LGEGISENQSRVIGVCFRAMRRLLLLIPFALLLAGCGGTSGGTNNDNQGHLGETAGVIGHKVTIILKDFTITPGDIKLLKPGKYSFELHNEGAQTHALKIVGNGVDAKSSDITFGNKTTFSVNLKKSGKYQMWCPVDSHKSLGMTGTITVG
jgi:plastocyanin